MLMKLEVVQDKRVYCNKIIGYALGNINAEDIRGYTAQRITYFS